MLTEAEFNAKNKRRCELIEKQYSGFTQEESFCRFEEHPGWKEECERRYHQNLTDAERGELETLTKEVDEYIGETYPLPKVKEIEQC